MDAATGPDDNAFVQAFQNGDPAAKADAFHALYERHAGGLAAHLERMTRCPHLAADLTQDAFLRVHDALHGFRGESAFRSWLYSIGINLLRDHLRKPRTVTYGERDMTETESTAESPADAAQRSETADAVRAAVAALPDELREVVSLVRLQGMRYAEAAESLGVTVDTVRMRIHRAHLALADALAHIAP